MENAVLLGSKKYKNKNKEKRFDKENTCFCILCGLMIFRKTQFSSFYIFLSFHIFKCAKSNKLQIALFTMFKWNWNHLWVISAYRVFAFGRIREIIEISL
jgi:hypothetical protein